MSVIYRYENLLKYKKNGQSYLEKMEIIESEIGLSFVYTSKKGESDFYKIEVKKPEKGIYKVKETKNKNVDTMDINHEELLKLLKINKKLKFVDDYIKKDRKKYIKN